MDRVLKLFADYAGENAWPPLGLVTTAHVEEYLAWLQARPRWFGKRDASGARTLSSSSVETCYRRLRRFWTWLVQRGHADHNPLELIPHPNVEERVIAYPSADQARRILAALDAMQPRSDAERFSQIRNRAALCLFLDSPGRLSELAALTLGDIGPDVGALRVMGKGRRERWMGLARASRATLRAYLDARDALSPTTDALWTDHRGNALKADRGRWLYHVAKRTAERAGLPWVHPHAFRHRYVMESLESEMPYLALLHAGGWRKRIPETYFRTLGQLQAIKAHRKRSPLDRLLAGRPRA